MEIIYLGHSAFLLKDKQIRVVMDPCGKSVGFKQAKVRADIVTISHNHGDHSDLSLVEGEPKIINGPGEYEIKGVSVTGIPAFHDNKEGEKYGKNTIYVVEIDELRVAHLGDLGHILNKKQVEIMDGVDVLMVNAGAGHSLNPEKAMEVVKQLEPIVVLPMHFKSLEHNKEFSNLLGVDDFVKLSGMEPRKEKKLSLKKDMLNEEMELVLLDRYGK